jgi:hypothetical protein
MGFFDFVKEAGEKLFRAKDTEAASEALAGAPDDEAAKARVDELNRTASQAIEAYITTQGLPVTGLTVTFDGASGVATVFGVAGDQASKEKILLCCGNVTGVSQVNDMMSVDQSQPGSDLLHGRRGRQPVEDRQGALRRRQQVHAHLRGQQADAEPSGQDLSRSGAAYSAAVSAAATGRRGRSRHGGRGTRHSRGKRSWEVVDGNYLDHSSGLRRWRDRQASAPRQENMGFIVTVLLGIAGIFAGRCGRSVPRLVPGRRRGGIHRLGDHGGDPAGDLRQDSRRLVVTDPACASVRASAAYGWRGAASRSSMARTALICTPPCVA